MGQLENREVKRENSQQVNGLKNKYSSMLLKSKKYYITWGSRYWQNLSCKENCYRYYNKW